jgi:PhnB protein
LNGTPVGIFLYVPNVDATYKQAVDAGATPTMPPSDMFWGDRYGKLKDPFGHEWSLGTHIEDVPPAEMGKRQEEFFAQMAAKK